MYKDELKELLELNTNIFSVWIDADGNWHTSNVQGAKEVSRDEVLKPKKAKANE